MTDDLIATPFADAGRWVVDCPAVCGTAWSVPNRQGRWVCFAPPDRPGATPVGCGAEFRINWPADLPDEPSMRAAQRKAARSEHLAYTSEAEREFAAQHTPAGEPDEQ